MQSSGEYLKRKQQVAARLIAPRQGAPASLHTQMVKDASVAGDCCKTVVLKAPVWTECCDTKFQIATGMPYEPVEQQVLPRGFWGPVRPKCC